MFVIAGARCPQTFALFPTRNSIGTGPIPAGLGIQVALTINIPGWAKVKAETLVAAAHRVWPNSNTTRGNSNIELTLTVDQLPFRRRASSNSRSISVHSRQGESGPDIGADASRSHRLAHGTPCLWRDRVPVGVPAAASTTASTIPTPPTLRVLAPLSRPAHSLQALTLC